VSNVKVIYSEKKSYCSICSGRGYLYKPSARKKQFSFLEICECIEKKCQCEKKTPYMVFNEKERILEECACLPVRRKIEKTIDNFKTSNIPVRFRYRRISEFEIKNNDKETQNNLIMALDNAHHFIERFSTEQSENIRGLYIFGPPGTGKTFLACLILNELILQYGISVKYVKITRDFFNEIKSTFNLEAALKRRGDDIFKELLDKDVLVIDDFGVQADTSWEQRTLYDLIDARYEYDKPTIITSNLSPEEISEMNLFGGRIVSRLKEMTEFQPIICSDYRDNFQEI